MRHKKSIVEMLFELLIDLTDFFWQVGAVMAMIFSFLTYKTLLWIIGLLPRTLSRGE